MNNPTLSQGARLTAVHLKDLAGQSIGKVIEWMMDVEKGQIVYVIIDLEGSEHYFAVPWSEMKADLENGGYKLDVEKVKSAKVIVDRQQMSELVNDKQFIQQVMDGYRQGGSTQSRDQASTPSDDRSRSVGDGAPSNAEVSEGRGYGG